MAYAASSNVEGTAASKMKWLCSDGFVWTCPRCGTLHPTLLEAVKCCEEKKSG